MNSTINLFWILGLAATLVVSGCSSRNPSVQILKINNLSSYSIGFSPIKSPLKGGVSYKAQNGGAPVSVSLTKLKEGDGAITKVAIQLSTDGGVNWSNLTEITPEPSAEIISFDFTPPGGRALPKSQLRAIATFASGTGRGDGESAQDSSQFVIDGTAPSLTLGNPLLGNGAQIVENVLNTRFESIVFSGSTCSKNALVTFEFKDDGGEWQWVPALGYLDPNTGALAAPLLSSNNSVEEKNKYNYQCYPANGSQLMLNFPINNVKSIKRTIRFTVTDELGNSSSGESIPQFNYVYNAVTPSPLKVIYSDTSPIIPPASSLATTPSNSYSARSTAEFYDFKIKCDNLNSTDAKVVIEPAPIGFVPILCDSTEKPVRVSQGTSVNVWIKDYLGNSTLLPVILAHQKSTPIGGFISTIANPLDQANPFHIKPNQNYSLNYSAWGTTTDINRIDLLIGSTNVLIKSYNIVNNSLPDKLDFTALSTHTSLKLRFVSNKFNDTFDSPIKELILDSSAPTFNFPLPSVLSLQANGSYSTNSTSFQISGITCDEAGTTAHILLNSIPLQTINCNPDSSGALKAQNVSVAYEAIVNSSVAKNLSVTTRDAVGNTKTYSLFKTSTTATAPMQWTYSTLKPASPEIIVSAADPILPPTATQPFYLARYVTDKYTFKVRCPIGSWLVRDGQITSAIACFSSMSVDFLNAPVGTQTTQIQVKDALGNLSSAVELHYVRGAPIIASISGIQGIENGDGTIPSIVSNQNNVLHVKGGAKYAVQFNLGQTEDIQSIEIHGGSNQASLAKLTPVAPITVDSSKPIQIAFPRPSVNGPYFLKLKLIPKMFNLAAESSVFSVQIDSTISDLIIPLPDIFKNQLVNIQAPNLRINADPLAISNVTCGDGTKINFNLKIGSGVAKLINSTPLICNGGKIPSYSLPLLPPPVPPSAPLLSTNLSLSITASDSVNNTQVISSFKYDDGALPLKNIPMYWTYDATPANLIIAPAVAGATPVSNCSRTPEGNFNCYDKPLNGSCKANINLKCVNSGVGNFFNLSSTDTLSVNKCLNGEVVNFSFTETNTDKIITHSLDVITRSGVNSPIKVNYSCEKDIVGILGAQFLKEDGNPIGENENFVKSAYDVEVTLAHAPLKPITKIAIIPYTVDETSQLNPCSNLPSNLVKAAYINASMIGDREVLVKNVALNPIAGKSEDNPKGKSQGVCIGLNDGYYEYGLQANGSYNLKKNLETHNLILGKTPIIESIDLCSTESFDKGECDQISASGLVTLKVTAYSPDGEFDENNKFNFVNFLDLNVERPISNYSFSTYLSKYYSLLANQSGATDFLSYTSTKTSVPPIAGSTRQGQRIVTALRFKVPSSIINTPLLYMIGVKDKSGNMSATSTSPVLNSSTQHTEISKFSGSPISSIAGSAKNAFSPISTIFAKQNFSVDRATADIIFSHSSYNSRLVYKLSASTNKVSNLLEDFSQTINPSVYSYLLNGREYSDIFHLNPGPSLDRRKSRLLYLRTYNSLVEIDLENKEVPLKTIFDLNTFKIKLSDGTLKSFFLGSVGSSSPQAEIDAAMGKYLVFNIAGYVSMTSDGTAYLIARCPFVPNFVSQSNQILKLTPNSTEFIPIAGRCASNRSFNAQIDKPIATTDPIIRPLDLQLASEGLFNNSYANSLTVAEFGDKRVIYYNSHHRDGSSNTPDHPMVYKIIEDTINSSNSKIITPFGITSFPSGNGSINTYPGISIYMHLGETRLINKDLSVWKIDATDTVNFRENPITSNTFGVGGLSSEGYLLKPGSFDMETFKGDCSGDGMAYDSNCIRTLGKIVVGGPIVQAANAPHPNLYFSESLGGSLYRVRTLSDFNSERTPVVQTELGFKSREFGYSDRSVTYFSSLPSISYQKTDFGIFKKGLYFMDIDRGTLSYYPEEQDHTLSKSARIVFGSPYYFGSHNETNLLGRKMGGGTRDANTGIFDTTAGDGYNINFTTSGKPLFVYGQRIHRVDFIDNNYQMTNLQTSYLPAPIENQKLISNTTTDNISVQNLMNNYQSRISDGNFSFIEKANSLTLFINAYFYRQQKSPVMGEANYSASSFIKKLHWSDQLNPLSGKIFHVMGNPNVSGYHSQTFLPNKPALTVGLEEIKKLDMDHRFYQSSLVLAGGLFADNRPSPQSGGLANETRVYIGDYDHIRLLQNPESVNEAKLVTLCSKLPGDFKITHLTVRKQGMTNKPDELIYETQNRKIYRHVVRMNADGSFGSSDCSNDDLVGSYSWSKMSSAINNSNRMTWKENPETEDQQTLFISIVDQILEVKFKD